MQWNLYIKPNFKFIPNHPNLLEMQHVYSEQEDGNILTDFTVT
jgi:hypothetical protein